MSQTREQWLEARRAGIGGSDAAAVLGISGWKTNVQLWEEKTGRRADKDLSGLEYIQYGVGCEPHMRAMFILDYPHYTVEHVENTVIQHPDHPFIQASLDGVLTDTRDGRLGVLEIKTAQIMSRADRIKWDQAQIPQIYYAQILHYMLVTGVDFAAVKSRLRSEWDGEVKITEKHYHYERQDHEESIAYLLEKEIEFWQHVESDTRPDLILPEI